MTATRLILAGLAAGLLAVEVHAAPPSGDIPLPRERPALPSDKSAKVATHPVSAVPATTAGGPMQLTATAAGSVATTASIPSSGVLTSGGNDALRTPPRPAPAAIPLRSSVPAPPARTGPPPPTPIRQVPTGTHVPAADSLAIPGFDSLSASQVVQRLDGLTRPELVAVRTYEAGNRGRRTILNRVDQLLDERS